MEHSDIRIYDIAPKETDYNGTVFRSRLEARWALFFDRLGVKWSYETETFQLPEIGQYTPDFHLPDFQCFVEIKPSIPSILECKKVETLSETLASRKEVAGMFFDMPMRNPGRFYLVDMAEDSSGYNWRNFQWGYTEIGLTLNIEEDGYGAGRLKYLTCGYDELRRFNRVCDHPVIDILQASYDALLFNFEKGGRE